MKKFLSLLTATVLTAGAGTAVVACNKDNINLENKLLESWKEELKKAIKDAEYSRDIFNWEIKNKKDIISEINEAKKTLKNQNSNISQLEASILQLKWQIIKFKDLESNIKDEVKQFSRLIAWATELYNKGLKIENTEKACKDLYGAIKNAEKEYNNEVIIKDMESIEKACKEFVKNTGITTEKSRPFQE